MTSILLEAQEKGRTPKSKRRWPWAVLALGLAIAIYAFHRLFVSPEASMGPEPSKPTRRPSPPAKPQAELPRKPAPALAMPEPSLPKPPRPQAHPPTDPTRPPAAVLPRKGPLRIDGIVIFHGKRIAYIHGRPYTVGDSIDGARIVAIDLHQVVIDWGGEKETIVFHPSMAGGP